MRSEQVTVPQNGSMRKFDSKALSVCEGEDRQSVDCLMSVRRIFFGTFHFVVCSFVLVLRVSAIVWVRESLCGSQKL